MRSLFAARGAGLVYRLRAELLDEEFDKANFARAQAEGKNAGYVEELKMTGERIQSLDAALQETGHRNKALRNEVDALQSVIRDAGEAELKLRQTAEDGVGQLAEARQEARAWKVLVAEERGRAAQAIHSLNAENDRLMAEHLRSIEDLNSSVSALRDQLAAVTHNAWEHGEQIRKLLSSSSWRLTRPLRIFSRTLRGDWKELARLYRVRRSR